MTGLPGAGMPGQGVPQQPMQPQYQQPVQQVQPVQQMQPQYQQAGVPGAGLPGQGVPQQPTQQPMQQPVHPQYQQAGVPGTGVAEYANKPKKNLIFVGTVTHTGNQLFEINGNIDVTDKFPDEFAFVWIAPSIMDNTKQSNRSYVLNDKINMKFSSEELHGLAEALTEAGMWGRCSFTKFSDPKKSDSNNNTTANETKKFTVTAIVEGEKVKVFMNIAQGSKKITMPLEKYAALGLAHQIHDLATEINKMKFELDRDRAKNFIKQ